MLSKPEHGWTDFSLGSSQYALSYLTGVPLDWLDQAIHGLETMLPFTVHGFCEPGRILCTVSYWNCHIIFEDDDRRELKKDETQCETAHISMLQFCKNLYDDISRDIEDWSQWSPSSTSDSKKQQAAAEIQARLDHLKGLIAARGSDFDDAHCFL